MSRLNWNQSGTKTYQTGTKKGVLYPQSENGTYPTGYAWQGLTGVNEAPSGAEPTAIYADDVKYLSLMSAEDFAATITCYDTPPEFDECDGTAEIADGVFVGQQSRKPFGFCYRTAIGNDTKNIKYGYKLHIIYGALAKPSSVDYKTVNESPEAIELSYEVSTTPVSVSGMDPTAKLVIDSTKANPAKLKKLEDILYGTEEADARLPLPDEIASIMKADVSPSPSPSPSPNPGETTGDSTGDHSESGSDGKNDGI